MNHWIALVFLAAGIILAVMEMATLTFYLAALSFASLATALYTWLYPPAGWQAAIVFAVAAIIALPLAHLLRRRMQASRTNSALDDMDRGALVTVAEDTNGNLKVKYRDSLWEAVWEGTGKPQIGARAHKWWRVMARVCASGLWANKDIFIFQGEFPWVFPFQQSSVYSSSCGPWL